MPSSQMYRCKCLPEEVERFCGNSVAAREELEDLEESHRTGLVCETLPLLDWAEIDFKLTALLLNSVRNLVLEPLTPERNQCMQKMLGLIPILRCEPHPSLSRKSNVIVCGATTRVDRLQATLTRRLSPGRHAADIDVIVGTYIIFSLNTMLERKEDWQQEVRQAVQKTLAVLDWHSIIALAALEADVNTPVETLSERTGAGQVVRHSFEPTNPQARAPPRMGGRLKLVRAARTMGVAPPFWSLVPFSKSKRGARRGALAHAKEKRLPCRILQERPRYAAHKAIVCVNGHKSDFRRVDLTSSYLVCHPEHLDEMCKLLQQLPLRRRMCLKKEATWVYVPCRDPSSAEHELPTASDNDLLADTSDSEASTHYQSLLQTDDEDEGEAASARGPLDGSESESESESGSEAGSEAGSQSGSDSGCECECECESESESGCGCGCECESDAGGGLPCLAVDATSHHTGPSRAPDSPDLDVDADNDDKVEGGPTPAPVPAPAVAPAPPTGEEEEEESSGHQVQASPTPASPIIEEDEERSCDREALRRLPPGPGHAADTGVPTLVQRSRPMEGRPEMPRPGVPQSGSSVRCVPLKDGGVGEEFSFSAR